MFISNWLQFTIFALATFRLTRLLVFDQITNPFRKLFIEEMEFEDESGNKEIYVKAKSGVIRNFIGELLSCYWCTSIWCSIFLFCLYWWNERIAEPILIVLAIAGAGAFIETMTQRIIRN